jgi:hypothetical protein
MIPKIFNIFALNFENNQYFYAAIAAAFFVVQ